MTNLKKAGVTVLGIGQEPYDKLPEGLKADLTEYYYVDNLMDYDQAYRAVAFFAHKYGRIDRIESHEEYWLELDAKLRTDFNVEGLKTVDMPRIKFKSEMKKIFMANSIPCAKGKTFETRQEADEIVKKLGFPVIVKPNSGVGASDTWKISNEAELDDFFKEKNEITYIMEEFIKGDIVTFDGMTNQKGEVAFYNTMRYHDPAMNLLTEDIENVYYVPNDPSEGLVKLGHRLVKAFNIPERFFHVEFFALEDGRFMALEINCRPAGGPSLNMVNHGYSMDIFQEYANLVTTGQVETDNIAKYNAAYISRKNKNTYRHSHEEIMEKYQKEVMEVMYQPEVYAEVMGDVGYIVRTLHLEDQNDIMNFILEK